MLTAYIKFCGGCNPTYDRGAAVDKLKKIFDGKIQFFNHDIAVPRELGILVQGCEKECVLIKNLAPAEHYITLRYESDVADAVMQINAILNTV